ncbi:tRNA (uridine(54)-C5)-methyltransferase TrmA [Endozoicomonas numazuensis]|uniref:tRNA/tmRNA (uracil-C(5))-methyltransferase n=1 Tax=Endozoicomonas numazuensis TaxID=1137799 RepID=A0A081NK93_9GAMM|nr:tRNA (uridine(54)-C5)-methyltransferase TrmA [Endozoicomonas numazuensis]KEQ18866.1 tRNA (uracil-5-)-methyltransferase [Endozoicomonas numazuensis]
MSLAVVEPEKYAAQLAEKVSLTREEFQAFDIPELEIFRSRPEHYRMRAEFRIWHEGEHSFYRMFDSETKQPFSIDQFPAGSERINQLMMPLMRDIEQHEILRKRLFQMEFLTTQTGEALISMLYHKQLNDVWKVAAEKLQTTHNIRIIGRARKQKVVLDRDYVVESLKVLGKTYQYTQVENSFTQPNAGVNEHMLGWASRVCDGIKGDLLELYCGNGNFTCVLANHFDKVLATEISKTSVNSAHNNFKLNNIQNVQIARLSSEEFTQAMNRERLFRRLQDIDLDSYQVSTIFVDPPRAGLDAGTETLVQNFDNIVYISCNPETLKQNLEKITETHTVQRIALFDQFPYTHHREMGVFLTRK